MKLNEGKTKTMVDTFKQSSAMIDKDNSEIRASIVAANLELIQGEIAVAINNNRSVDRNMIAEIYKKYLGGKSLKDEIDWPTYGNTKAKKCNLDKYIESVTPHKQQPKLPWTKEVIQRGGVEERCN